MPNIEDKIALFDLDGSLADFEHALRRDLNAMRSQYEPEILGSTNLHELEDADPAMKARMDFIKAKPGWWRNLERIESGFQILHAARDIGFKIHVLTKAPARLTTAWTEKVEWCRNQPELINADIHLTTDKSLTYGTLLFDDYPAYLGAWMSNRRRGLGIMPVTRENATFTHPNLIKWDGTNFDHVAKAMMNAYARESKADLVLP